MAKKTISGTQVVHSHDVKPDILIQQYKVISDDMRFYGDQRFKIITVYIVTNGFLLNFIKDNDNIVIGFIGIFLSIMCLFWDIRTKIWWGALITRAQEIEQKIGHLVYQKYNTRASKGYEKIAFLKPSSVIVCIYCTGLFLWLMYILADYCMTIYMVMIRILDLF
jgi:hypothetical protein